MMILERCLFQRIFVYNGTTPVYVKRRGEHFSAILKCKNFQCFLKHELQSQWKQKAGKHNKATGGV